MKHLSKWIAKPVHAGRIVRKTAGKLFGPKGLLREALTKQGRTQLRFMFEHSHRASPQFISKWNETERLVAEHYHLIVAGGPFQKMRYVNSSANSGYVTKLLGSYEAELAPYIEQVCENANNGQYAAIVDIGCAEGYYAVGMALRCPAVPIIAYDSDKSARSLCQELARKNDVENRIEIHAACSPLELSTELQKHLTDKTKRVFVLCDIEGGEFDLLNPAEIPELMQCDMLIELHDFLYPPITSTLVQRFKSSHDIEFFDTVTRRIKEVPSVAFLPKRLQRVAIDDRRGHHQSFMWCKARLDTQIRQ